MKGENAVVANERSEKCVLAEYNALRNEIIHLNGLVSSTLHISVLASLGAIGYLVQVENLSFLLFPVPFLILIPCLYTIISRFQAVMRVSGYIRVFLEEESGLRYENRYLEWLSKPVPGFSFRKTMFYLHLCLGLLAIGVFISKGCLPDSIHSYSTIGYLLLYISPFPFYYYAFRIIKKDWRQIFDEYWKEVKKSSYKTAG